jgi:predicted nucleotidyltransferase
MKKAVKLQGFSTHLLDQAIRDRKEAREKQRLDLLRDALWALDKLTHQIAFDEAYLFGSITKPYHFSNASDLDIGFIGLKDEDFFRAIAFLSRELGTEVDVVQLEGYRMAEKIKKEGKRWRREG